MKGTLSVIHLKIVGHIVLRAKVSRAVTLDAFRLTGETVARFERALPQQFVPHRGFAVAGLAEQDNLQRLRGRWRQHLRLFAGAKKRRTLRWRRLGSLSHQGPQQSESAQEG